MENPFELTLNKKIKLGEEQIEALAKIRDFIKSDDLAFSLTGAAGTGKTFIINEFLKNLYDEGKIINTVLCAPTHKAALVLSQATNRTVITLHSLLALSPKLDIFELDLANLLFKTDSTKLKFPIRGLVICDEASMINDELFKALIKRCKEFESKIIFMSDSAQLLPVKQDQLSLVYKLKNQFNLTKIYRQSEKNAILPVLETLRSTFIRDFKNCSGEEGSLIVEPDLKNFIKKFVKIFNEHINENNIFNVKIAAYTNKRVDLYNQIVKSILFKEDEEYCINEILTGTENFKSNVADIYNGMDYIVKEVIPMSKPIPYTNLVVDGYLLKLYDPFYKCVHTIYMLSKKNSDQLIFEIACAIERIRVKAIQLKEAKKNSGKYWGMYYSIIESFCSPFNIKFDERVVKKKAFTEGYACTIHKLQGSSINNMFVDMKDINTCKDSKVKQQLQYVALSRTRNNVYIYQ